MKTSALILAGVLAATTADIVPVFAQDPVQDRERERDKKREPQTNNDLIPNITVQGKVESFTAGKSITLVKADGTTATFTIPEGARVPNSVTVGSKVTVRTRPNGTVVESITLADRP